MSSVEYAPQVLDPKTVRLVRRFYRAAVVCTLFPMLAGVGIVLGYWATYARWMVDAGLLMLPIGTCMVIIGLAFCIISYLYQRKADRLKIEPIVGKRRLVLTVLLLLLNFPVAFFCAWLGIAILSSLIVDVINETGSPIDSCVVTAPGDRKETHGLAPGSRFRANLDSPHGDGSVDVVVVQGGKTEKISAIGYVTNGEGDHVRVHLKPGLTATVEELR